MFLGESSDVRLACLELAGHGQRVVREEMVHVMHEIIIFAIRWGQRERLIARDGAGVHGYGCTGQPGESLRQPSTLSKLDDRYTLLRFGRGQVTPLAQFLDNPQCIFQCLVRGCAR